MLKKPPDCRLQSHGDKQGMLHLFFEYGVKRADKGQSEIFKGFPERVDNEKSRGNILRQMEIAWSIRLVQHAEILWKGASHSLLF